MYHLCGHNKRNCPAAPGDKAVNGGGKSKAPQKHRNKKAAESASNSDDSSLNGLEGNVSDAEMFVDGAESSSEEGDEVIVSGTDEIVYVTSRSRRGQIWSSVAGLSHWRFFPSFLVQLEELGHLGLAMNVKNR